jgi:hypothetical protein
MNGFRKCQFLHIHLSWLVFRQGFSLAGAHPCSNTEHTLCSRRSTPPAAIRAEPVTGIGLPKEDATGDHTVDRTGAKIHVRSVFPQQLNHGTPCGAKQVRFSNRRASCAFYSLALIPRGVAPGCYYLTPLGYYPCNLPKWHSK